MDFNFKRFGLWWYLVTVGIVVVISYLSYILIDNAVGGLMEVVSLVLATWVFSHPTIWMAAVALFFLAIARLINLEIDRRPRLKFSCGSKVSGSKRPTTTMSNDKLIYWRMLISSDYGGTVKDCSCMLIGIRRDGVSVMDSEHLNLTWSLSGGESKQITKDIRDGASYFVDVLFLTFRNKVVISAHVIPKSLNFNQIFDLPGQYELLVIVSGDNIKSQLVTLLFDYTDNWDTAKLEYVSR